ncbi:hypothetical protein D3C80_2028520 [compost metagenome]
MLYLINNKNPFGCQRLAAPADGQRNGGSPGGQVQQVIGIVKCELQRVSLKAPVI